ncbi:MAG: hypothetical protein ACREJ3_19720 [Polyangiaceae bacterium]
MTLVSSLAAMGCSSSSNSNNPSSPVDSGMDGTAAIPDATSTEDGGGTATPDSGSSQDGGGTTLYTRLGGHAGIRSAIDAIVLKELADPQIASYFFNQVAMPVPAGHPTAAQIEECFTDLLASLAGGTEVYPPSGGVNPGDAGTFMCRDMTTIHQPLLISGGTFDKFVSIAAAELTTLGVAAADIGTIGAALNTTEAAIVSAPIADAGLQAFPGDAGSPVDAGGQ